MLKIPEESLGLYALLGLTTTGGDIIEKETDNSVIEVVGKIFQTAALALTPFLFNDHTCPISIITFPLSAAILTPLTIKGLKKVAEKSGFTNVKSFLDSFDKVFMTGVKIANLALFTLGLITSVGLITSEPAWSILFSGIYLALFLANFYPIFNQIQNYLTPKDESLIG